MATLIGSLAVVLTAVMALPSAAVAWHIPGHMLSGSLTYQILRSESPATIAMVIAILEKHPWYETHWREQLERQPKKDATKCLSCSHYAERNQAWVLSGKIQQEQYPCLNV